ncbi:MAG: winged helix-turn-helix transcriptional regulator [Actinopolymorphaceae bacterium]
MSQRNTAVTGQLEDACPIVEVLDHVAGKWSIGILVAAGDGPIRFTELERHITGISRRMLTLTLRRLERDGLLVRTVYPTVPPKVEYTLTDMARELCQTLATLTAWAERHRSAIATARLSYDVRNAASAGSGSGSARSAAG